MAIAGDTSDNIAGVPRFGIKTAVKHMSKVGWDIDHPDLHPALIEHRPLIERNLRLIDLRAAPSILNVPAITPFLPTQPGEDRWREFHTFCSAHDLRQLISRAARHTLWTS
jgi:hypothetical protein